MSRRSFVTFTGGLGAQVLSAAIYFDAQDSSTPLLADLRYFDRMPRTAESGDGTVSIWPWALDGYGLARTDFEQGIPRRFLDTRMIDGAGKGSAAVQALAKPSVRARFPVSRIVDQKLADALPESVVLHLRRGDYLNVASHLVSDEESLGATLGFSGLLNTVCVLSDSPVPQETLNKLRSGFPEVLTPQHLDDIQAHTAMRLARVLVTSNSQFSLTAGLLRDHGMTLIPGTWFGTGHEDLEAQISSLSGFRILRGRDT